MPPKKLHVMYSDSSDDYDDHLPGKLKKSKIPKDSDEYKKRRERNNVAVRKSRQKSRQKAKETVSQVAKLREENEMLEQKVMILSKELSVLKDLFLAHAGTVAEGGCNVVPVPKSEPTDHEYSLNHKIHKI